MNRSPNTTPRGPGSLLSRNGNRLSQRGMLSILMLMASIGALGFALLGGSKLVLEPGGATLSAPRVSIQGTTVAINGTALVDVDGALITLN